jgi:hypothetical protein
MTILGQSVGTCHHEQGAVHHAHDVKRPRMRVVKDIAGKNFPTDHEGQGENKPSKELPNPSAYFVDGKKNVLHKYQSKKSANHQTVNG